jgi:hypothetical protein
VKRGGGFQARWSREALIPVSGLMGRWQSGVSSPMGFGDGRRRPGRGPVAPGEREG